MVESVKFADKKKIVACYKIPRNCVVGDKWRFCCIQALRENWLCVISNSHQRGFHLAYQRTATSMLLFISGQDNKSNNKVRDPQFKQILKQGIQIKSNQMKTHSDSRRSFQFHFDFVSTNSYHTRRSLKLTTNWVVSSLLCSLCGCRFFSSFFLITDIHVATLE